MFQQLEWRVTKQISGFLSRLGGTQRKKPSATAVEQTEEDQTDGEEEEWEREDGLAPMRQSVHQDINLCHPLQYRGENLCSLHRRGKLHSKFKIKELADIRQQFWPECGGTQKQESVLRFHHFCPSSKLLLFQEISTLCFISLCFSWRSTRSSRIFFKFSSAYITRQCKRAKKLCAAACDVKLGLHAPMWLYRICRSDSVGALSTHVFRLFFVRWMFEDLSNICLTKDVEQTSMLNAPALSDQQMLYNNELKLTNRTHAVSRSF